MCGIAALLDPAGTAPESAARAMCDALRHRGPDGDSVLRSGPATLVHTRLAIIDLATGDQRLRSMRGLVPDPALARHKYPFATPYDDWLRPSLGTTVEHRSGPTDHKRILYCLLELSKWDRTFVER